MFESDENDNLIYIDYGYGIYPDAILLPVSKKDRFFNSIFRGPLLPLRRLAPVRFHLFHNIDPIEVFVPQQDWCIIGSTHDFEIV